MSNARFRTQAFSPPRPILLLTLVLSMVVGLVVWTETSSYRAVVEQQRQLARHSVAVVSSELSTYLDSLKRVARLILKDQGELFAQLTANPDASDLHATLHDLLSTYHQEHLTFTLADARGNLFFDDFDTHTGEQCRSTIQSFARNPSVHPKLQIHPGPRAYHIDIVQPLTLQDGRQGIFFASYKPSRISQLLTQGAPAGQQLFLVRDDQPGLIEVSAEGSRDTLKRDIKLSKAELELSDRYGASAELTDTNWRLLAIPDAPRLAAAERAGWIRGVIIISAAVLFGLLTLLRIRQEARRRRGAELALRQAHADLEQKVVERTTELSKTNAALAAQITRRRKAEKRMTMLSRAVEYTGDSIILTDRDGIIAYANPAFARLTGLRTNEVIGTSLAELQTAHQPSEFMRRLWTHLEQENAFREIFCIRKTNGEACYTEQTITPLRNSKGEINRLIATGKDITERMDSERRLSYLAHHDTLTGLPNRALMFDRLGHALARANRQHTLVALLFMDIDRFKTINDSLGHQAGDELLVAVAKRLDSSVRRSDSIARLGGDEFVAILEDIRHNDEPVHVATSILAAIAEPLLLAGQEVSVSSSMGIALYPEDAGDANALLQCADTAMYRAKAEGGNNYNFYTADMTAEAQRRLRLENRLRKALENSEFCLRYQPRLDLISRRITAVEALLRWQPADGDMLSPADFMAVLEETGLIRKVGEWVLQQTCADFGRIKAAGHQLRIACNLSAKQFRDEDLVEMIDRTVLDQSMRHEDLELELTENMLSGDIEHTSQVLGALHDRGVRISVDDFGTGYSSLTCLKRFPIDDLKVDKSFVRDLNDDKEDATIVTAIISLAHSLGLGAVAEGVETQAQLQTLGLLGCDEVQGMLVSEPLSIDELLAWLKAHRDSFA